ncbi:hypothetical protein [Martelella radicis]|uniref:Uncharacterized protein n=1 Tax=Martelella radicis TaxID=1397476 RepID=A0A7W6PAI5_9HYPH|nr:hypothetical protein [Martelella radicis]MBB4122905.1 hypothetical protein [Martelella radicis]
MDRITGTAVADLGGGKRGFQDQVVSTGAGSQEGTVVTAEWLNGVQEEILNVITRAGLVPAAGDFTQLAQAIQGARLSYAEASGTVNALTVSLSPAPTALRAGLLVRALIAAPNTGSATLNVNGHGAKAIVNRFGLDLTGGELTGIVDFVYDGAKFYAPVAQSFLGEDRTYYVNSATGSDTDTGLAAGSAFATIQRALDVASAVNLNGHDITISVADGSYPHFASSRSVTGGKISIEGNLAAPSQVSVVASGGNPGISISHGGYAVAGFAPQPSAGQSAISVVAATVEIGSMHHSGVSGGAHIACGAGGAIFLSGSHSIAGGASIGHLYAADGGSIRSAASLPSVEFVATSLGFGAFAVATNGSINALYSAFAAAGNATGPRYAASLNGVINTNGSGSTYYPGSTAGTTVTGGQYA